ncbi:MAG: flagellar hook assembly protein FlgD [Gammaproteobacteria bacterium]|nr:flagellar hook assembly protein FlgD [Gammaproteobacteria bacterium]
MSTIESNTALLDSLGLSRQEPKTDTSNELGGDDFMTLMIAQMQYQDPLEPMSNEDFVAQLAQFSASTGIQDLNTSFDSMSTSLQSYQALQASTLVGRSVLLSSDSGLLDEGGSVDGMINLTSSTQQLTLGIYDQSGALVRREYMGMQSSGTVPFEWNGLGDDGTPAAAGVYEVRAEALVDGKTAAMETLVYSDVESVSISSRGGVLLNLAGVGSADLSDVYQIK